MPWPALANPIDEWPTDQSQVAEIGDYAARLLSIPAPPGRSPAASEKNLRIVLDLQFNYRRLRWWRVAEPKTIGCFFDETAFQRHTRKALVE